MLGDKRETKKLWTAETVLAVAGFAIFWPVHRFSSFYPLFTENGLGGAQAIQLCYAACALLEILLIATLIGIRKHIEPHLFSKGMAIGAGIVGFIGALLVSLPATAVIPFPIKTGLGILLLAASLGVLLVIWGYRFSLFGEGHLVPLIASSIALSSALYAILYMYDELDFFRSVASPLLSSVFLFLSIKTLPPDHSIPQFDIKSMRRLPLKIGAFSIFLMLFLPIYTRLLSEPGLNVPLQERVITQYCLTLFFALFAVVSFFNTPSERMFSLLFILLVLLALFGLMIVVIARDNLSYGAALLNTSKWSFEALLFIVVVYFVTQMSLSSILAFGVYGILAILLPGIASTTLINFINDDLLFYQTPYVIPVTAALSFVIFAVALLVFNGTRPEDSTNEPTASLHIQIQSLCSNASEGKGLTPRELEIMTLYYQGYSTKRVATQLGIAESTVQSYSRSLYQKLQIHSKQELIDLVNSSSDCS